MEQLAEKIRVLVVEDDADALMDIASLLGKENYAVSTAGDGMSGFQLFEKEQPEIVILDITLPKMDGLELLHKIKSATPVVPVIMMTGYGSTEKAISALKDDAFDYLKKPIDINYLIDIVALASQSAMENRRRRTFPTIMLADDDKTARESLAEVLGKEGWTIIQAVDGEDAVQKFLANKVDIAVLDINMPKQNGLTALKKMRDATEDFEAMICTGYGDEDAAIRAMRDGAMNFIRKPIDIDNLIVTIEKGLEKLSLTRSLRLRNQEIDFAKQIIARITEQREIIINLKDYVLKDMIHFAQELVISLGVPMMVFNQEMQVRFLNPKNKEPLLAPAASLDEINRALKDAGIDTPYARIVEVLKEGVKQRFSHLANHEVLSIDSDVSVTMIPLQLLKGRIQDKRIVVLLHKRR